MYNFWNDNGKPKYGEKAMLCYMDTDTFIVYIKTDDIYIDIEKDLGIRFNISNYKLTMNFSFDFSDTFRSTDWRSGAGKFF